MKIKTVQYMATVNLGNYSNEKIGFTAQLDDGDSPESVIEKLRQKAMDCALPNTNELFNEIRERGQELRALKQTLNKTRKQWESTAEFLRTQGIKPDVVDMPQFINLLPQIEGESVIEGEMKDEDEDEDRFF